MIFVPSSTELTDDTLAISFRIPHTVVVVVVWGVVHPAVLLQVLLLLLLLGAETDNHCGDDVVVARVDVDGVEGYGPSSQSRCGEKKSCYCW